MNLEAPLLSTLAVFVYKVTAMETLFPEYLRSGIINPAKVFIWTKKFREALIVLESQWATDITSVRTREALQFKIRLNQRAGQVPYGLQPSEGGKTLNEYPPEQKVIRLIQRLKATSLSLHHVCRELERSGNKD